MGHADDRRRLLEILRRESLRRGDFVLSSGRRSSTYLDCRRTTLHPEGGYLTARLLLAWLAEEGLAPHCVGGPTLGADPMIGAMVALSHASGQDLAGFLVRKEAKGHGAGRLLEGPWRPGWTAVVVEDTVTTGASLLRAVRAAEEAGMRVVATAALVDREEGARELLGQYRYRPVFTLAEVAG